MTPSERSEIIRKPDRLKLLNQLGLLDLDKEEALDRLTRLVSKVTNTPVSLISIVDADRQFFKSLLGTLPEPYATSQETPLSHSFCQHVVATNEPLVVEDAREVDFLKDNLAIPDLNVIAYLGMPLTTPQGVCLGSFCVIDDHPRKWTEDEIELVRELALSVMAEIELKAQVEQQNRVQRQLQLVLDQTPIILYALDENGVFVLSEGKGLEALDRQAGDSIGTSIYDMYKDNRVILDAVDSAYEGKPARITTSVGDYVFDAYYQPLLGESGEVIGVAGLANDVTIQRRVEAALKQSLKHEQTLAVCSAALLGESEDLNSLNLALRAIQQGLGISRIFWGNLNFDEQGEMYTLWERECAADGLTPVPESITSKPFYAPRRWLSELKNSNMMQVSSGPHLEPYHAYFGENDQDYSCFALPVGAGEHWSGALGLVKQGADLDYWTPTLVGVLSTAAQMIHIFMDRQKRQAELAKAHAEALAANRLKNQILAKVSHELKTPLGAILGYSELIQQELYGPVTKEQTETLGEIIESTDYLNELVNELLTQARLDSDELKFDLTDFTIETLFLRVEQQVSILAKRRGVTISFETEKGMPGILHNDIHRLQQILMNLVSNGIKFTDSGGRVEIRAKQKDEASWLLQVQDSGIGIPKKAQELIFLPFRQVDGSATRANQRGTGLGLSITHQLVTLMGGAITLESEVGKGSLFSISLPYVVTGK